MACCSCLIALTLGLLGALAYIWYNKPSIIIRLLTRLQLCLSGCKIKYVQTPGIRWCYAEKGAPTIGKPTMVFVHGFLLSKDMWLPVINSLPDYHVILVDLPGHGDSSLPPDDADLTFNGFSEMLHKFILLAGLNHQPLHLVGMSLGGTVVGLYAAKFPKEVQQVTLICPAMKTPTLTPFSSKAQKSGNFPMLTTSIDNFADCIQLSSMKPMPTNEQLLQGLMAIAMPRHPFYKKVFKSLDTTVLPEMAHEIKTPSQIIWGRDDQMVDISGAGLLKERLANCQQCDIFDNCGHLVNFDQTQYLANCLIVFRQAGV